MYYLTRCPFDFLYLIYHPCLVPNEIPFVGFEFVLLCNTVIDGKFVSISTCFLNTRPTTTHIQRQNRGTSFTFCQRERTK